MTAEEYRKYLEQGFSDVNIEDYFTIELSPEYVKENKYYFNYLKNRF